MLFNPLKFWLTKGPFNKLFVNYITNKHIRWYQKVSVNDCWQHTRCTSKQLACELPRNGLLSCCWRRVAQSLRPYGWPLPGQVDHWGYPFLLCQHQSQNTQHSECVLVAPVLLLLTCPRPAVVHNTCRCPC